MPGQEPTTDNQQQEGQEPIVAADKQQGDGVRGGTGGTAPVDELVPRSMVEKARSDAAKYRTKYQNVLKSLRQGQLPDTLLDAEDDEEARSLLDELKALREEKTAWEQERRTTTAKTAVKDALVEAGADAKKIGLLMKAIDPAAITFNEKGQPTNVKKLVDGLKDEYTDLFKPSGKVDAETGGLGGSGSTTMNDLIRGAFFAR